MYIQDYGSMIALIAVPYHLGEKEAGVGGGPSRVIAADIASQIGAGEVIVDIGPKGRWEEVNAALAGAVLDARARGLFPLISAGNCNSCLGTLEAISDLDPGIVWFDAHGDFNTPQTSLTGSIDGMALTLATERFVPEERVVLAGGRDLDPLEGDRVREHLLHIPDADLRRSDLPDMRHVYVHVDIDVLSLPGLGIEQLLDALGCVFAKYEPAAVAITNYNPERDSHGDTFGSIRRILEFVAGLRRTAASR